MQNLMDDLLKLLKKDERLVSQDGVLLKNQTQEFARKNDPALIKLLLSDKAIKQHFFFEVEKVLIFDKEKFVRFVSNKQFLPDSYTTFSQNIGLLHEDGRMFREINAEKEVVLVWPYKDCILEGGMTKEDLKRDEIFYNETLAPDDINRLMDAKVFTDFKRIDKKGEHKLDGFKRDERGTIKDNLIIKGNNLLALASLKKEFAGKVKLIYIDPPYNTGGAVDTFTYNNDFDHSTWLVFMKNRLEIAKSFLREDGFIAITIDHEELYYLGALADEVFRRENRVGLVTIYINPKGRQHEKFFSAATEYMLIYAKNKVSAKFNKITLDDEIAETFDFSDDDGDYRLEKFIRARTSTSRKNKPDFYYPIYVSNDLKDITLIKKPGYKAVFPIQNGVEYSWKTISKTFDERNINGFFVAKKEQGEIVIYHKYYEQQVLKNLWTDKKYFPEFQGTNLLKKLLGANLFSYPKSLYAVVDTLKIMTSGNDIVMDFFAGSGTTGHATLALNEEDEQQRQFILVEQLDRHIDVCIKRIKKVLEQSTKQNNFIYMGLAKWNEDWIEKIEKAKTGKELAKLWDEMKEIAFLSYKVDPKTVDASAKDFADLSIADQKKFLVECLDKNQLYINLSEIEDKEYGVSKDDKDLNKSFYNGKQ